MHVILLGTAAGGGFPQWNCWCPSCRVARSDPSAAQPRTQSSAALSADGKRWFLLNASPDVREQLTRLPETAAIGIRRVPIEGVVLTDAELDHTLGVVLLREAGHLALYGTAAVIETVECDTRLLPVTRAFADVPVTHLPLGAPVELMTRDGEPSGLTIEAFEVPAGPPRFASAERVGHTVGLTIVDRVRGSTAVFAPGCGALDDGIRARLRAADLVLFDGTFWTDDELIRLGIGDRTARQMDHLPVSGPDGSLAELGALPAKHRVYTHINNTNPMLLRHGAERRAVEQRGLLVGADGMTFTI
jgi:pyrroloquinoline quinone biosynthesis protein B